MTSQADSEELLLLAEELASVKEAIREASRQLLRIERRVTAAFPGVKIPNRSRRRDDRPRLDESKAKQLIVALKEKVEKGEQIERELGEYSVKPELQILARILGLTNVKLPPKDELVRRISTRLRQSVSVTSGFHEEPLPFASGDQKRASESK